MSVGPTVEKNMRSGRGNDPKSRKSKDKLAVQKKSSRLSQQQNSNNLPNQNIQAEEMYASEDKKKLKEEKKEEPIEKDDEMIALKKIPSKGSNRKIWDKEPGVLLEDNEKAAKEQIHDPKFYSKERLPSSNDSKKLEESPDRHQPAANAAQIEEIKDPEEEDRIKNSGKKKPVSDKSN